MGETTDMMQIPRKRKRETNSDVPSLYSIVLKSTGVEKEDRFGFEYAKKLTQKDMDIFEYGLVGLVGEQLYSEATSKEKMGDGTMSSDSCSDNESNEDLAEDGGHPWKKPKPVQASKLDAPTSKPIPFDDHGQDIMRAILYRATQIYTDYDLLLPDLSPQNPTYPAQTVAMIQAVENAEDLLEKARTEDVSWGSSKRFQKMTRAWRRSRREDEDEPGRWVDLNRAFDSSSLIALATLTDLLAEEHAKK